MEKVLKQVSPVKNFCRKRNLLGKGKTKVKYTPPSRTRKKQGKTFID